VTPVSVLVVDDSTVVRRLVTTALEEDPRIRVVGSAANGQLALAKIDQLAPDVVTLDLEMPVMDGIEVLKALRKTHPHLPVVVFSTLTERGGAKTLDALSAGAADYVTKPMSVRNLDDAVRAVREQLAPKVVSLHEARLAKQGLRQRPAPLPQAPSVPGRPRAACRVLGPPSESRWWRSAAQREGPRPSPRCCRRCLPTSPSPSSSSSTCPGSSRACSRSGSTGSFRSASSSPSATSRSSVGASTSRPVSGTWKSSPISAARRVPSSRPGRRRTTADQPSTCSSARSPARTARAPSESS
jgi:two-component system chemotaxis response regulator CheB